MGFHYKGNIGHLAGLVPVVVFGITLFGLFETSRDLTKRRAIYGLGAQRFGTRGGRKGATFGYHVLNGIWYGNNFSRAQSYHGRCGLYPIGSYYSFVGICGTYKGSHCVNFLIKGIKRGLGAFPCVPSCVGETLYLAILKCVCCVLLYPTSGVLGFSLATMTLLYYNFACFGRTTRGEIVLGGFNVISRVFHYKSGIYRLGRGIRSPSFFGNASFCGLLLGNCHVGKRTRVVGLTGNFMGLFISTCVGVIALWGFGDIEGAVLVRRRDAGRQLLYLGTGKGNSRVHYVFLRGFAPFRMGALLFFHCNRLRYTRGLQVGAGLGLNYSTTFGAIERVSFALIGLCTHLLFGDLYCVL